MAKESENKEISGKSQVDKKASTAAGVGCLVVLIVIIVIIGFKFFGSSSKPSSWPTSEITPETVTAALREDSGLNPIWQCRNFKDNIVKVEVIDSAINPGHKNLSVFFKIGQVWDETDLVRCVGGTVRIRLRATTAVARTTQHDVVLSSRPRLMARARGCLQKDAGGLLLS